MPKVRVKDIPVRYENERYGVGVVFQMKTEHVMEKLVEVLDEGDKTATDKTAHNKNYHEMTKNELLEFAKVNGFSVSHSMKKEDILSKIEGEQNGSEQSELDGDSGIGATVEPGESVKNDIGNLFAADYQGDSESDR
ncbi:hypothetical protein [Sporosarcina sp. P17b]|uniref:hypothetical protein n=1 Tax=Sporosarcina sp. P17b TaxID=2048260 RepID=UPI001303F5FB|nr:hypothetical protein [Sporosarcina sp. P17b]